MYCHFDDFVLSGPKGLRTDGVLVSVLLFQSNHDEQKVCALKEYLTGLIPCVRRAIRESLLHKL